MPPQRRKKAGSVGVYGHHHDGRRLWTRRDGTDQHAASSLEEASEAMGIDWMTWHGLTEAIPPAYAEYLAQFVAFYKPKDLKGS